MNALVSVLKFLSRPEVLSTVLTLAQALAEHHAEGKAAEMEQAHAAKVAASRPD